MAINEKTGPTRLVSLRGFDRVLMGRDLNSVFKNGHVYEVYEIMGEIIFKDLGEHAVAKHLTNEKGWLTGRVSHYMQHGATFLTKEEYKAELANSDR